MSTLMSTDINLSRPSTRVRASPGGATTICFGDEHITSAKPPMAPVAAVVVATKPIVVPPEDEVFTIFKRMEALSISSSSKTVGIALAAHSGAEEITVEVAKSLAAKGITNVVVSLVESASVLPYLVKQMTEKCSVILAIGLLNKEETYMKEILIESLIQTGLTQKCPVVPAFISPSSILELKSSLHHSCPGWANSVCSLLALGIVPPTLISSLEIAPPAVAEVAASEAALPKAPTPNNRRAQGGAATLVLG